MQIEQKIFGCPGMKRVVLSSALLLMSALTFAQNKVTGNIKDANGEPLIGVSVVEVGTSNGTVTDANGNYTLNTKPGAKVKVSCIGFVSQIVEAGEKQVVLQEDNTALNEVVVVGYGTMRRKDVTSSITTVSAEDLNQGVFTDPAQMLQGKVAGLVVSSTGDPSGTPSITLRGASSLREGDAMQPYYVIDGIPGMDISMVAPDDIESIDVLRDASATAIYGSKAANGVIIITTKSGQEGRTNVTYNGYVAVENVLKRLDMATASELRASGLIDAAEDAGGDTDWQDEVLRTGVSHNHNLSISGGNKKTKYVASLNYMNHDGVVRGTSMNRFNGRALLSTSVLKEHLDLSAGVNAMLGKHHGVPVGNNGESVLDAMNYYSPLNPVYDEDGNYYTASGSQNYNPLSMINEDANDFEWRRIQFTGKASLKVIDGLLWNANYSFNSRQKNYSYYNSSKSQLPYGGSNGKAHRDTSFGHDQTFETYINYDKTFNQTHKLGVMLGYSWEERVSGDGFGVSVYNFYNDDLGYKNIGYANLINGMSDVSGATEETVRNISFYGRVNYSYDSRYMLQATLRRDGSSVFGANNRWGTFPSVSAAWNIAEEDFMEDGIFDQLKLRVGYGVSGNSLGFGAYSAVATYGLDTSSSFSYDGQTYYKLQATKNANPDLKWESTAMFNAGIDFAFFDSRLSGSIEFYNKKTSDLIWSYAVSTNKYPYGYMNANVGDITNTGIEISINAVPVQTDDFSWSTTLNISHNKNQVDKLSNANYSVNYSDQGNPRIAGISNNGEVQRIMEGEAIGTFWTYEWAGYNAEGKSLFYEHDAETGERTGTTTTDPQYKDKAKVGCAQPKLTYGWNNTLNYKNWSLTAFFQGTLGNKIMNTSRAHYSSRALLSGWKNVLSEALSDPYFATDDHYNYPSDRYLENGSYLRLSTLTLGYTFKNFDGWLSNIQLYATAKNVFTVTSYEGIDPEVNLGGLTPGIDYRESFYPHTRSFIFGAKVNF